MNDINNEILDILQELYDAAAELEPLTTLGQLLYDHTGDRDLLCIEERIRRALAHLEAQP